MLIFLYQLKFTRVYHDPIEYLVSAKHRNKQLEALSLNFGDWLLHIKKKVNNQYN